jgi:hypothetical protein
MMTPMAEIPAYHGLPIAFRTERAKQNGELTHKAVQARQAHRRERRDQHDVPKIGVIFHKPP